MLQTVSATLRSGHDLPDLPDLRAQQRQLASSLHDAPDAATADLLVRISDRLVDNIDTLAHVVRRSRQQALTDDYGLPI